MVRNLPGRLHGAESSGRRVGADGGQVQPSTITTRSRPHPLQYPPTDLRPLLVYIGYCSILSSEEAPSSHPRLEDVLWGDLLMGSLWKLFASRTQPPPARG